MDKERLQNFLIKARTKTYAGNDGKVASVLAGSKQLEWQEGDWLYRDVYYAGNGIFDGLEVVHFKGEPIWSMCYFGNFKNMSEEEIDRVLRKALLENWKTARLSENVEWSFEDYKYICSPNFEGDINEIAGSEEIWKNKKKIYVLYYAGGFIGKEEQILRELAESRKELANGRGKTLKSLKALRF